MNKKDNRGRVLRTGEQQRKDGSYMYRYTDKTTGERRSVYANSILDLRDKEREIERDIEDAILSDGAVKKMTVNSLFETLMDTKELEESTRNNYVSIWNNRVRNGIGQMRVVQIKPSHIRLFYSELSKKGYSRGTIKTIHAMLNMSLEMAVDDDIIRKNPARGACKGIGKEQKVKEALTITQQERLLSFMSKSNCYNMYLPMIQIMLGTGCRCGELIGLTWHDVDMDKKTVAINNQLIYKDYGDGYKFHLSAPKTNAGVRIIPMSNTVYEAFIAQKRLNSVREIPCNVEIEGKTDFIFTSRNGRPLMPSAVNNVLYNIVKAYNKNELERAEEQGRIAEFMPSVSAHTLRHTCCTRMAESGMDIKVVQYIMGHASIDVTMNIYNHIADNTRVFREIEKMNRAENFTQLV